MAAEDHPEIDSETLRAYLLDELPPGTLARVEKALRDTVQRPGPVPVAAISGQAGQAEAGASHVWAVPVAAADPQGRLEHGPRAVRVAVLAQHPAQVERHGGAFLPDRPRGSRRMFQVGPGGGEVAGAQGMDAGVVAQHIGDQVVTRSLGAGDGLGI